MPTGSSFECRSSKSPRPRFAELPARRRGHATVESVIPVGRGVPSRSRTRRSSPAATPLSGRWRRFGFARTTVAVTQKVSLVLCGQTVHLGHPLCYCQQLKPVLTIHCILPEPFRACSMAPLRATSRERANAMPRRPRPRTRLRICSTGPRVIRVVVAAQRCVCVCR
jgi:hypothetical protein